MLPEIVSSNFSERRDQSTWKEKWKNNSSLQAIQKTLTLQHQNDLMNSASDTCLLEINCQICLLGNLVWIINTSEALDLAVSGLLIDTPLISLLRIFERCGNVDNVKAKAKEVAQEDFSKARDLATSAAKSGAYLYPIKGIFYFVSHRSLWKPLLSKLLPTMSLSLAVIVGMFVFTYLPQLAVLVFVNGPLAAFTTILLTLSESSTLINILSRTFLLQDALVDTFDGVLVARRQTEILAEGRQLKSGNFNDPIAKLGKLVKSPFEKFTPKALVRYVMYLPLNFIPVVGTVLFVLLQGKSRGNSVHTRYFQLKKWSNKEREDWLKENTAPYTAFGTVATLLELVPVVSIFFSFTNTVGAALWAADIESNNTQMTEMSDPRSRDGKKAE